VNRWSKWADPAAFARLRCAILGHRWRAIYPGTHASVLVVCLRCRENGWRLL